MKWYPIIRILLYLREIESKEKNYEESYFGHRPRSGIENRWPKSKAKVKGVLLLELFGSLIPKISINFGIRIFFLIFVPKLKQRTLLIMERV